MLQLLETRLVVIMAIPLLVLPAMEALVLRPGEGSCTTVITSHNSAGALAEYESAMSRLLCTASDGPADSGEQVSTSPGWHRFSLPVDTVLVDVEAVGEDEAWAVGLGGGSGAGTVLHFRDGRWRTVASDPSWYLWAISMTAPRSGWVAGYSVERGQTGSLLLQIDQGAVVERLDNSDCSALLGLSMASEESGLAVGKAATAPSACILRYNGGLWRREDTSANGLMVAVVRDSVERDWVLGSKAEILRYQQDEWRTIEVGLSAQDPRILRGADMLGDAGWAVGTNGLVLKWADDGWERTELGGDSLYGVALTAVDAGWAVGAHGGVESFATAIAPLVLALEGGSWSEHPVPSFNGGLMGVSTFEDAAWAVGGGVALFYGTKRPQVPLYLPLLVDL